MITQQFQKRRRNELEFDDWIRQLCQQFTGQTGLKLHFISDDQASTLWTTHSRTGLSWKHRLQGSGGKAGTLCLTSSKRNRPQFLDAIRQLESMVRSVQQVKDFSHERLSLKKWLLADSGDQPASVEQILKQASEAADFRGFALFLLDDLQRLSVCYEQHKDARIVPEPQRAVRGPDADAMTSLMTTVRRGDRGSELLPDDVRTAVVLRLGSSKSPYGTLWVFDRRIRSLSTLDEQFLMVLAERLNRSLLNSSLAKVQSDYNNVMAQLNVANACLPATELHWERDDQQITLASHCRSVDAVGGDLCEYWPLADGSLVFAIGDATGHHVPAAMVMSFVRGALYSHINRQSQLSEVMTLLNSTVYALTQGLRFMSLVLGRIDPHGRQLTLVNAGHLHPYVIDTVSAQEISDHGLLLGILPNTHYRQVEFELSAGQTLLLMTDGITEAQTHQQTLLGATSMISQVQQNPNLRSIQLVRKLWQHFISCCNRQERKDDSSVMVIRSH